jgi:ketosteroid isomerase-like protein
VRLRSIARAKGGTGRDLPEVHVWTVRHGKAVSFDNYVDTAIVVRALPDMNRQPDLER